MLGLGALQLAVNTGVGEQWFGVEWTSSFYCLQVESMTTKIHVSGPP